MSEKITKDKAKYTDYGNKARAQFCRDCSMYRQPNKCTLVKGFINPGGACQFWERKGLPTVDWNK